MPAFVTGTLLAWETRNTLIRETPFSHNQHYQSGQLVTKAFKRSITITFPLKQAIKP